jgi:hypothetical protein
MVDNFLFTAQVSIGTPPKIGTLLVTDSSPYVTIYGTSCNTCGNPAFYNPSESLTYVPALNPFFNFDWFGITSLNTLGYDTVCILGAAGGSDLCNSGQLISMIDSFTTTLIDQTFEWGVDGSIGLGRSSAKTQGFLERAVSAGTLAANTWSYQPSGDFSVAGSMILGGYDSA